MSGLWIDTRCKDDLEEICKVRPDRVSYNYAEDVRVLREDIAGLEAQLAAVKVDAERYLAALERIKTVAVAAAVPCALPKTGVPHL